MVHNPPSPSSRDSPTSEEILYDRRSRDTLYSIHLVQVVAKIIDAMYIIFRIRLSFNHMTRSYYEVILPISSPHPSIEIPLITK